mgnify:CR=1 FL=1
MVEWLIEGKAGVLPFERAFSRETAPPVPISPHSSYISAMKRYPIGIQDFSVLREGGYLYVDKTQQMYELLRSGRVFFLSRPRRFGKSLLFSTLKYFFQGRRDLFQGLWVDRETDHDWAEHPVLHFSFSTLGYQDLGLEAALNQAIDLKAKQFGLKLTRNGLGQKFEEVLEALGSGPHQVVLLIDEYDKPLVDYLDDLPQAEANRKTLKTFFSVIKDADPYLRFFFITGVSKFSKVSLFSDLNHLNDLTIHPRYATLTGYTPAEMDHYFGDEYPALAEANGKDLAQIRAEIQRWYNGYQWAVGKPVYNPFSVLRLFDAQQFSNYWWDSGTPTFLLKALKREFKYDLTAVEVGPALLDNYTLENLDWRNLLFQTGYLTITDYDEELSLYTLGYPNREVEFSMCQHLMATYRHYASSDTQVIYAHLKRALDKGDLEMVIAKINEVFFTIPYQIFEAKRESFFHAILHLTFQGLGLLTQSEVSTAQGRVDTVVQAKSGIYVMEFKLDEPAQAAMDQIREQRYGSPYLDQGQPVTALGVSFSSETKEVEEWEARPYAELLAEG